MSTGPSSGAPSPAPPRSGLARAATSETFSLAAAVGGPRGVVEAVLPGLAFVTVFTVTRDLRLSLAVALAGAGVAVLARLVGRLSLAPALSGAVGVAVCAWSASRTGDAADFYTPGFVINTAYAVVLLLSTLPWPRVGPLPVIGLLVGPLTVGPGWRQDRRRMRIYQRLTWAFAALFVLRLAVQLPLYYADQVGALGVARLVMGVPLFAALAWLSWAALRERPASPSGAVPAAPGAPPPTPRP